MADKKKDLIGINAYAKHRGVTRRAVQEHLAKGNIPFELVNGNRLINPEAADAAWSANVSTKQKTSVYQTGPKANPDHFPAVGEGAAKVPNIHVEEAYTKAYRRRLVSLELAERQGKLIEKEKVAGQIFTAVRIVRDAICNIPQKLAPELAAEVDPHKVELILMEEINNCLMELSELAKRFK